MFDFGFWELFLIMVVALLVVGPERLPGLARQVGLWIGKAKRFVNSVRSDIEREIRAEELKQILNQQQSEIDELKKSNVVRFLYTGKMQDAVSKYQQELLEKI